MLVVDKISFGYGIDPASELLEITFNLSAGQWLGITGSSGSGKTTLARILAGLYSASNGQVYWQGQSLPRWDQHSLRRFLGFVDQQNVLFAGTLRENLLLGCRASSDQKLLEICSELQLLALVERLPGGLGGWIEEGGSNVSGGERQRIDLARMLVGDYSAWILDEATSALDSEIETLVLQALRKRKATCIFVSHRPSVLTACDEVILLKSGRVQARGSHQHLIKHHEYSHWITSETSD